ncbi:MAG: hypothetical protein HUU08_05150 [Candidatus Brocadia sp.]|nr:hypothetical protein [Candidatus Brocadia sp.]
MVLSDTINTPRLLAIYYKASGEVIRNMLKKIDATITNHEVIPVGKATITKNPYYESPRKPQRCR